MAHVVELDDRHALTLRVPTPVTPCPQAQAVVLEHWAHAQECADALALPEDERMAVATVWTKKHPLRFALLAVVAEAVGVSNDLIDTLVVPMLRTHCLRGPMGLSDLAGRSLDQAALEQLRPAAAALREHPSVFKERMRLARESVFDWP